MVNSASTAYFTPAEIGSLDSGKIPRHIAIIPDGNRRWAKKHESGIPEGHREGSHTVVTIAKAAKQLGIKVLTLYTFSTENWTRPQEEVDALMWLLKEFLVDQRQIMLDEGIRLQSIGDLSKLPPDVVAVLDETKAATANGDQVDLVLALNYGGRDDLARAIRRMMEDLEQKKLSKEAITETTVSQYLDTVQWPDPELLIRTSGEMRVSNFLLWQISYSEIYVTDVLWPDFSPQHLLEAVLNFQKRDRRLGGA